MQSKQCVSMQYEHPVVRNKQYRLDTHLAYGARLYRPYDSVVDPFLPHNKQIWSLYYRCDASADGLINGTGGRGECRHAAGRLQCCTCLSTTHHTHLEALSSSLGPFKCDVSLCQMH